MKIEIKSRPGTFITLDDDVAEKIGGWAWYLNKYGYACAHLPGSGNSRTTGKNVFCSRAVIWAVMGEWPPKDKQVDHLNHDKLDNQISNLRVVTPSLNQRNKYKNHNSPCRYKGIHLDKRYNTVCGYVLLRKNGEKFPICGSMTKDERIAAMCYDCITHLIGGFLLPNFPDIPFDDKWAAIGEPQRKQITHSFGKYKIKLEVDVNG